jgi:hypothetical protein
VRETEAMMKQTMVRRSSARSHGSAEDEAPMTFEKQLMEVKKESGLDAARRVFN